MRSSTLAILVTLIGLGKLTKGEPNASAPANENMMQVEEEQQLTECQVYVRDGLLWVETKGGVRLFGINSPGDPCVEVTCVGWKDPNANNPLSLDGVLSEGYVMDLSV